MTYNEFKMCCILFCKTFEGKKYGEVVVDCYKHDFHHIVTKFPFFEDDIFILGNKCIMWWTDSCKLKIPLMNFSNSYFENVKDFLNHFNIPLEDIV